MSRIPLRSIRATSLRIGESGTPKFFPRFSLSLFLRFPADAGPLMVLAKLNVLPLLKRLYDQVTISRTVYKVEEDFYKIVDARAPIKVMVFAFAEGKLGTFWDDFKEETLSNLDLSSQTSSRCSRGMANRGGDFLYPRPPLLRGTFRLVRRFCTESRSFIDDRMLIPSEESTTSNRSAICRK